MRSTATLLAQLRRAALLSAALLLHALPVHARAQAVPASLRACTEQSDPARRLACYDRQMAHLSAPKGAQHAVNPPAATSAIQQGSSSKIISGGGTRLTAHVVRLERSPDAMVLHLDKGQVWQQIGPASGDLSLREGDQVTIEKHLGSYWLSSRYVSNMRVRQKSR